MVELISSNPREKIKKELIEFAQAIIARRGQIPVFKSDAVTEQLINMEFINSIPTIVNSQTF